VVNGQDVPNNGYVTGGLFATSGTAFDENYGVRLYLYNGDLEVVPEPGTWALMLGGFALLVFIQRRRSKNS
jgi:hypothetical protein